MNYTQNETYARMVGYSTTTILEIGYMEECNEQLNGYTQYLLGIGNLTSFPFLGYVGLCVPKSCSKQSQIEGLNRLLNNLVNNAYKTA